MNYKVVFTFTNDDDQLLVNKAAVEVMDVDNKAGAIGKIHEAMLRKFEIESGTIKIDECRELTYDDILDQEEDVKPAGNYKPYKGKPFFEDNDHLSFGEYTTNDFMNSKEFSNTLDSIN